MIKYNKANKKKNEYKVVRIQGAKKKGKETFLEFGYIKNPTFNNDVYVIIHSAHKGGSGIYEMRTDEALMYIQGLSMVLNKKITGM